MSGFGGFCPLPLRLGGSATEGWTAAQHARMAADLAAAVSAGTDARITVSIASGVTTILDYQGSTGVGLANAPTVLTIGPGACRLQWPQAVEDEYGTVDTTSIRHTRATAHTSSTMAVANVSILAPNLIEVIRYNNAGASTDGIVTVSIAGGSRASRIGHYDGATDKQDSIREEFPYAAALYDEYTAGLGSAFTTNRTGIVHCRKLALARAMAAVQRGAEKLNANSHPNTADDMLGEWVSILKVRVTGTETKQEIRQLCAAKFVATTGNDSASIDKLCQSILGDAFVGVTRPYGTSLDSPPSNTYWAGINPGLPTYDLGGGTWFSERSQLVVQVNRPAGTPDEIFDKRLNTDLFLELDRVLPAHATFTKSVFDSTGFRLDLDPMDGKGML